MNVRTSFVIAAVAAVALTGCTDGKTTTSAAPTSPATEAATSAAASPAVSTPANTPAGSPASTTKPAGGGDCTPSEATLLEALRSSKVNDVLAPTDTLSDITCYQGYALGLTHPKEADNAEVVFHYTGGAWHAVNGGTAGYCDGVVPAAVRSHLKHC